MVNKNLEVSQNQRRHSGRVSIYIRNTDAHPNCFRIFRQRQRDLIQEEGEKNTVGNRVG